jgi:hypothetical protein
MLNDRPRHAQLIEMDHDQKQTIWLGLTALIAAGDDGVGRSAVRVISRIIAQLKGGQS